MGYGDGSLLKLTGAALIRHGQDAKGWGGGSAMPRGVARASEAVKKFQEEQKRFTQRR